MMQKMRSMLVALGVALLGVGGTAQAYTEAVSTPTPDPYYKAQVSVAPGAFSDTFTFSLAQAAPGSYLWVFPFNPFWDPAVTTTGLSLTLVNDASPATVLGTGQTAAQLGINLALLDPANYLLLSFTGWTPDASLFWQGDLGPGDYTVSVSGVAGAGGGAYIAKFHLSAVPEPSTWLLALSGVVLAGVVGARRRQRA